MVYRFTKFVIICAVCIWCTNGRAQIGSDFVRQFGRIIQTLPNQMPFPNRLPLSVRPSIDCNSVRGPTANPVAVILCSGPDGAAADWDLNSTLWAALGSLGDVQQKSFDKEQEDWRTWLNTRCKLTTAAFISDQQRLCAINEFHLRASVLRARLSGDALSESKLTAEQHALIQNALIRRNFLALPPDGEFGPSTRQAIRSFQASEGADQSGFLTQSQIAKFFASDASRPSSLPSGRPVLSGQESALLMARLRQFWVLPEPTNGGSENSIVQVRLRLSRNGSLLSPPQVISAGGSQRYFAAVNAALNAIKRAQPFDMLSSENYEAWQELTLTFDPLSLAAPPTKQIEASALSQSDSQPAKSGTASETKQETRQEARSETKPEPTPGVKPEIATGPWSAASGSQTSEGPVAASKEKSAPRSTSVTDSYDGTVLFFIGFAFFAVRAGYYARKAEKNLILERFNLSTQDEGTLRSYEVELKKYVLRMKAIFEEADRDDLKVNLDGTFHRGSKKGQRFNTELETLLPQIEALKASIGVLGTTPLRNLRSWSCARTSLFSSVSLLLFLIIWHFQILPLSVGSLIIFALIAAAVDRCFRSLVPAMLESRQQGIDKFRGRWDAYDNIDRWVDEQIDEAQSYSSHEENSSSKANDHAHTKDDYKKEQARNDRNFDDGQRSRSWWVVLGISANATLEEIKAAWRKKVKEFHSDRLKGIEGLSPEFQTFADQKLAEINQAYEQATAQFKV
jgi:peptidoglycan hydrolase-like protein with peptidoglycan-binding domain